MKYSVLIMGMIASQWSSVTAVAETHQWPQWRGPDRTDVSHETGLLQSWPEDGPRRIWLSQAAGIGYSGPAIVDGRLFTMGARPIPDNQAEEEPEGAIEQQEYLIVLDAETGREIWSVEIGAALRNNWGDGPRGTPTVDGDFVYGLGAQGNLICASVTDGTILWRTALVDDLGGSIPKWGYAESVLIDGEKVLCTPGGEQGAMAALDKKTGEVIWRSKDFTDGAQYASIIVVENAGTRQYVQLTQQHLVGINAADGQLLWSSEWPGRVAVIPTPIFHNGLVYISSGYGIGCKLVQLDRQNRATKVYANKNMKNHHGGVILVDGFLYGYSDNVGWTCQDFKTGEIVWKERSQLGKGAIAYADGKFYCLDENDGSVVLIDASPDGWQEYGRFVLEPQTELRKPRGAIWTHPVIVDGKLYLRDQELLYCYDVRAR